MKKHVKEFRTLEPAGFTGVRQKQSRVIEVENPPKDALITDEPVRGWQNEPLEVKNGDRSPVA